MAHPVPPILVVSAIFPPAIGGSGHLLANVYGRMRVTPVTVLSDDLPPGVAEPPEGMNIVRARFDSRWEVLRPSGLINYLAQARRLRQLCPAGVIHAGRAVPEGVSAWLASVYRSTGFVCWVHGEELAIARTSRELTWLTKAVYRRAAAVIANSRNTASLLAEFGVEASRVHVVYPGVDVSKFLPRGAASLALRRRLADDDETLLLTVGRLQRRKGQDLVLKALHAARGAAAKLRYAIVGEGEDRARLEQLAVDLGVADRVTFVGAVAAEALPSYYAAADIFVHPNRVDHGDFEGFGIVFLEAAAAALPVIGGRSGGVPEAIEEGRTGMLVDGTDVAELSDAIRALADDSALRRRLGEAGRARVIEQFTWDRAVTQVAAIHAQVVDAPMDAAARRTSPARGK